jgi:CDP-diacylglycerol--glycerol-3-phosphate 3-phosphatidyltransferase
MLPGKTLTPSNLLSLLRVVLLIPILQALSKNTLSGNAWALFFIGLAVISDFLDGYLARALKQTSELGRVLDPIADKICLIGVTWYLTSPDRINPLPVWFLLALILRDVAVVGSCWIVYRRDGVVLPSNIWGKATSTVLTVTLIAYILQVEYPPAWLSWLTPNLNHFLLWLSLTFLAVSAWSYGRRFYLIMSDRQRTQYEPPVLRTPSQPQAHENGANNGN